MNSNTWTTKVEEDANGDLILPFPADMLAQMGWHEGTELWWDIQEDGKIFLKEHKDEPSKK